MITSGTGLVVVLLVYIVPVLIFMVLLYFAIRLGVRDGMRDAASPLPVEYSPDEGSPIKP